MTPCGLRLNLISAHIGGLQSALNTVMRLREKNGSLDDAFTIIAHMIRAKQDEMDLGAI
jgi:hypothetical protein